MSSFSIVLVQKKLLLSAYPSYINLVRQSTRNLSDQSNHNLTSEIPQKCSLSLEHFLYPFALARMFCCFFFTFFAGKNVYPGN